MISLAAMACGCRPCKPLRLFRTVLMHWRGDLAALLFWQWTFDYLIASHPFFLDSRSLEYRNVGHNSILCFFCSCFIFR